MSSPKPHYGTMQAQAPSAPPAYGENQEYYEGSSAMTTLRHSPQNQNPVQYPQPVYQQPPPQPQYIPASNFTPQAAPVVVVAQAHTPNQESFWGPFFSAFFLALFFGPIGLSFLCCYTTSINRRGVFVGVGSAMSAVGIGLIIAGIKLTETCKEKYWCGYSYWYYYGGGSHYAGASWCDCNIYKQSFGGVGGAWMGIGLLCILVATIRWFQDHSARRTMTAQTEPLAAAEKGYNTVVEVRPQQVSVAPIATSVVEEPISGGSSVANEWNKQSVGEWLDSCGLTNLRDAFDANSIDGLAMVSLTEKDMQTMNIPIGRMKRFFAARATLTGQI